MGEVLAVRNEDRAQNWFQVIQECRDSAKRRNQAVPLMLAGIVGDGVHSYFSL